MIAPDASPLVSLGIAGLAVLVLGLVTLAVRAASPKGGWQTPVFALAAVVWLAGTGAVARTGFFAGQGFPPPAAALVLPTFVLAFTLGFSRIGGDIAGATPLALLVGFHAFRLPLELIMHRAAEEGTMPPQMTFTGWNFDIVTGASAVVVAALVAVERAPRWLVFAWNALGSALLLAIIVIAIASLPAIHAFGNHPARLNTWVAHFPFVWLPAVLVGSALFGHIVLWRRIAERSRRASTSL